MSVPCRRRHRRASLQKHKSAHTKRRAHVAVMIMHTNQYAYNLRRRLRRATTRLLCERGGAHKAARHTHTHTSDQIFCVPATLARRISNRQIGIARLLAVRAHARGSVLCFMVLSISARTNSNAPDFARMPFYESRAWRHARSIVYMCV